MIKNKYDLSLEQHAISLEHVPNARELGGYTMCDGATIRRGLLIRCGALSSASDADLEKLSTIYSVTRVCDLRSEMELQLAPDRPIVGSIPIHLPIVDPAADDWSDSALAHVAQNFSIEAMVQVAKTDESHRLMRELYPSFISSDYTQRQFAAFLDLAAETTEGAILWHCAQGKDRTGWAAAFLLAALGADRELIIADFDLSNHVYEQMMQQILEPLRTTGGTEEDEDVIRSFIGCSTKNFIYTLNLIDQQYGSMNNYLHTKLGLTTEKVQKLRARYLSY